MRQYELGGRVRIAKTMNESTYDTIWAAICESDLAELNLAKKKVDCWLLNWPLWNRPPLNTHTHTELLTFRRHTPNFAPPSQIELVSEVIRKEQVDCVVPDFFTACLYLVSLLASSSRKALFDLGQDLVGQTHVVSLEASIFHAQLRVNRVTTDRVVRRVDSFSTQTSCITFLVFVTRWYLCAARSATWVVTSTGQEREQVVWRHVSCQASPVMVGHSMPRSSTIFAPCSNPCRGCQDGIFPATWSENTLAASATSRICSRNSFLVVVWVRSRDGGIHKIPNDKGWFRTWSLTMEWCQHQKPRG